jgi:hypothetical protein
MSALLSKNEWEVLHFIEEQHLKSGQFPALSLISRKTGVDQVTVVEALSNPTMQKSLEARGIQWDIVDDDRLTARQLSCIQLLLNVTDQRTIKDKLESLGIPQSTYSGWKKQPYFMAAYRQASENLYGESIPEVHRSLIQNAIHGDINSQKLMLAISGRWDTSKSVEGMNVQFVLMKVLEVIQRHVRDKDALEAIAGEFEELLSPNNNKAIGG